MVWMQKCVICTYLNNEEESENSGAWGYHSHIPHSQTHATGVSSIGRAHTYVRTYLTTSNTKCEYSKNDSLKQKDTHNISAQEGDKAKCHKE